MNNPIKGIHPILIKSNLYLLSQSNPSNIDYWVVKINQNKAILMGSTHEPFNDDFFEMLTYLHPSIKLEGWVILGNPVDHSQQWKQLTEHNYHPTIVASANQCSLFKSDKDKTQLRSIEDERIKPTTSWNMSFVPFSCNATKPTYLVHLSDEKAIVSHGVFVADTPISPSLNPERWMLEMSKHMVQKKSDCTAYRGLFDYIRQYGVETLVTIEGQIMFSDRIRQLNRFFDQNNQMESAKSLNSTYQKRLSPIVKTLVSTYGVEAVVSTFQQSPITITKLNDHDLSITLHNESDWLAFFTILYITHGFSWLDTIHDDVIAAVTNPSVPLPYLFEPYFYERIRQQTKQYEESMQLVKKINALETELKTTIDQVTKDPLTNVYNETFMKEFLKREIELRANDFVNKDFCLIYINIDDLIRLNAKYSKEIGDETIVHLGYILTQMAQSNAMVFKRFAPGFIYFSDNRDETPLDLAKRIQNQVRSSDLFIEKITVSLSIVQLSECSITSNVDTIITQMMSLGENRIKVGATKGNETINDATTKLTKLFHAKLLIIDEEPINVALLKTLFYNQNFDVTIATDADSAMNQLKNVAFDAIICERNLPKKDGFVIKNTLNEMPLNAKTLFILLTYQKTKDLVVRANQFDIDYVIQKPIIFEELLGFVQRHLRNRRQSS